jgi:glutamate racemase
MGINYSSQPIGVFDSGVGGISVLGEMIKKMPDERYIYFADSINAPYGTKTCQEVRELSLNAAQALMKMGVKALVVACNTATSAAINDIRERLDIPVIGMEPALKPAVVSGKSGRIVVMATPLTLKEEKFINLWKKHSVNNSIIPVPCPGLVELIESEADETEILQFLKNILHGISLDGIYAVVLGCTHYCFVKREISMIMGENTVIFDGRAGTVKHLINVLRSFNLLQKNANRSLGEKVDFVTTGDPKTIIPLCKRFLKEIKKNYNLK